MAFSIEKKKETTKNIKGFGFSRLRNVFFFFLFLSAKVVIRCHCDDLKQDIPAENLWFC